MSKRSRSGKSASKHSKRHGKTTKKGHYYQQSSRSTGRGVKYSQDMYMKTHDKSLLQAGPTAPHNVARFNSDFDENDSIVFLNLVPRGVGVNAHLSKGFCMHAIALKGYIKIPDALQTIDSVRMALVYDRRGRPTPILADDIWFTTATVAGVALTRTDNAPRFKILKTWSWAMTNGGSGSYGPNTNTVIQVDEFIKLKGKEVKFDKDDTTGVANNLEKGGLYLCLMGSEHNIASAQAPELIGNSRLYYYNL